MWNFPATKILPFCEPCYDKKTSCLKIFRQINAITGESVWRFSQRITDYCGWRVNRLKSWTSDGEMSWASKATWMSIGILKTRTLIYFPKVLWSQKRRNALWFRNFNKWNDEYILILEIFTKLEWNFQLKMWKLLINIFVIN